MNEKIDFVKKAIYDCAADMCAAALTAPKARGRDSVRTRVLEGEELKELADEMLRIENSIQNSAKIFTRDSERVLNSEVVVLIGSCGERRALIPCDLCGQGDCAGNLKNGAHCVFDDIDLGIAIGSAVSVAADHRIDNRVLYTAGMAARSTKMLGEGVDVVMAIPLSANPKNIYFPK